MTEEQTRKSCPEPQDHEVVDPVIVDRAYSYLLQVRGLENELMWTRSNIMLLVQGGLLAILASKFEVLANSHPIILVAMSLFGLATAYFWWRITKGGSFWIDFWQSKLQAIEHQVTGSVKLFRNHPSKEEIPERRAHFRRMGYISTRKTLVTVASVTMLLWVLLFIYSVVWSFTKEKTQKFAPTNPPKAAVR